jgi:diaminopimelate decarboxylase
MSAMVPDLLSSSAAISADGDLSIAGCRVLDLAEEYGTPLFIYDEAHLRERCREAVSAFGDGVAYATKAFLCTAMAQLAHEEGMHLDVATGGELYVALHAGVPPDRLVMHGNNKSELELRMALESGVGRIVVDSFDELHRIESLVGEGLSPPTVLVRVNPGVEAHTHEYLRTGAADSKFGFSLSGGIADAAIDRATASPSMELAGVHAHIGSQVFVVDSFAKAIAALAPLVQRVAALEFSIGGGLGVAYVEGESAPTITEWARSVRTACAEAGIESRILAEPGRSIVAQAALTVYRVGTIKSIDGVRTYVSVDGGMSDNPRPVLYGSGYEAFLPRATDANRDQVVRIVGKHCESGDVIVQEARVPSDLAVGDINYNMVLRPPVVFVRDGNARLVVRREAFADLVDRDV